MHIKNNLIDFKPFFSLGLALVLAACGGGGGSSSGGSTNVESSRTDSLSGVVYDSPVARSKILVYACPSLQVTGNPLIITSTDDEGLFDAEIPNSFAEGDYCVRSSGGFFESNRKPDVIHNLKEGVIFASYFNYSKGRDVSVVLTPLTTLGLQLADDGIAEGSSVESALNVLGQVFNGVVLDGVYTDYPIPLSAIESSTERGIAVNSIFITALEEFVAQQSKKVLFDRTALSVIDLINQIISDIENDGVINGLPSGLLYDSGAELIRNLNAVLSELRGTYGEPVSQYVNALSNELVSNPSSIYLGEFLDSLESSLESLPGQNAILSGSEYDFSISSKEIARYSSVEVLFNGVPVGVLTSDNNSLVLDTTVYTDGPYSISYVKNTFGGSVLTNTFQVEINNSTPYVVNTTNPIALPYSLPLQDNGEDITAATVNGTPVSIVNGSLFIPDGLLSTGEQTLNIQLTTAGGGTVNLNPSVVVDVEAIVINQEYPDVQIAQNNGSTVTTGPLSDSFVAGTSIYYTSEMLKPGANQLLSSQSPYIRFNANKPIYSYSVVIDINGVNTQTGVFDINGQDSIDFYINEYTLTPLWKSFPNDQDITLTFEFVDRAGNTETQTINLSTHLHVAMNLLQTDIVNGEVGLYQYQNGASVLIDTCHTNEDGECYFIESDLPGFIFVRATSGSYVNSVFDTITLIDDTPYEAIISGAHSSVTWADSIVTARIDQLIQEGLSVEAAYEQAANDIARIFGFDIRTASVIDLDSTVDTTSEDFYLSLFIKTIEQLSFDLNNDPELIAAYISEDFSDGELDSLNNGAALSSQLDNVIITDFYNNQFIASAQAFIDGPNNETQITSSDLEDYFVSISLSLTEQNGEVISLFPGQTGNVGSSDTTVQLYFPSSNQNTISSVSINGNNVVYSLSGSILTVDIESITASGDYVLEIVVIDNSTQQETTVSVDISADLESPDLTPRYSNGLFLDGDTYITQSLSALDITDLPLLINNAIQIDPSDENATYYMEAGIPYLSFRASDLSDQVSVSATISVNNGAITNTKNLIIDDSYYLLPLTYNYLLNESGPVSGSITLTIAAEDLSGNSDRLVFGFDYLIEPTISSITIAPAAVSPIGYDQRNSLHESTHNSLDLRFANDSSQAMYFRLSEPNRHDAYQSYTWETLLVRPVRDPAPNVPVLRCVEMEDVDTSETYNLCDTYTIVDDGVSINEYEFDTIRIEVVDLATNSLIHPVNNEYLLQPGQNVLVNKFVRYPNMPFYNNVGVYNDALSDPEDSSMWYETRRRDDYLLWVTATDLTIQTRLEGDSYQYARPINEGFYIKDVRRPDL